ncbi:DROSHA protein [Aphelenchoides avenae]|nr:DROSHA protein [Aphelenchus avenae]
MQSDLKDQITRPYARFSEEPKHWQQITAKDYEDTADLSDTDDEVDMDSLRVADSPYWSQSIAPGKYYIRGIDGNLAATKALEEVHDEFRRNVLEKIRAAKRAQPRSDPTPTPTFHVNCSCNHNNGNDVESTSSSSDSEADDADEEEKRADVGSASGSRQNAMVTKHEIHRKRNHPAGLHSDLSFNETGQFNDGPACKCSWASKQVGVRHNIFAGETAITRCNFQSSNVNKLYHYVLRVVPNPADYARRPTCINVGDLNYEFEGFSVFFHRPLPDVFPQKPTNRWTSVFEAKFSFTVEDLELFHSYLFDEILELYDLDRLPGGSPDGCPYYHCLPRFVRNIESDGKEVLPMSTVLSHFDASFHPLMDDDSAQIFCKDSRLFADFAQVKKGKIFVNPEKRPCAIRADLIDAYDRLPRNDDYYPLLTHYGVLPAAYAYSGKPE